MEFINVSVITIALTFMGVLAIGAAKAYQRITNPGAPENWDPKKFGIFVLVVGGVMLVGYSVSGAVEFPSDELIQVGWNLVTPVAAIFGFAYTTILGGSLVKRDVIVPIVASVKSEAAEKAVKTAVAAVPTTSPTGAFQMGFTVTPTYKEGTSPLPIQFKIYATQPAADHPGVTSVDIDWGDESGQNVPMSNGYATIGHIFSFVKTDKYTGHTFYPVFTFNGNDGSKTMFNVDGKGVEIWVKGL
jgi:hypothetical protein